MSYFRTMLDDHAWSKIKSFLASRAEYRGAKGRNDRLFIESILWILRTGSPWRDLPKSVGNWSTIYMRFFRWARNGTWQKLQDYLSNMSISESNVVFLDSTVVRAHQHAAGGRGGQHTHAIGRSRGGLSSKIHVAIGPQWNVYNVIFSAGQESDIAQATSLVVNQCHSGTNTVVADKGYDAGSFVEFIRKHGGTAVIPPRSNRKELRYFDKDVYKRRNIVERFFARIKQFRRIATRYDKTRASFTAMFAVVVAYLYAQNATS